MTLEQAIEVLISRYNSSVIRGWTDDEWRLATDTVIVALRSHDPDTGLVPCEWCGPERMGWFSVQFWVRASTGKRKWMSVTQKYKKQVNYCPMCGRKMEGRQ
jgi:hypothetical protein